MALTFYDNFRTNIAYTPTERYVNDMQNAIYNQWMNSTQTTGEHNNLSAQVQSAIGSNVYNDVDISIDMAIDLTTGTKLADDFKIFSHKEMSDVTQRGLMYKFNDNYWLTTDTDEYGSPIKSIGVRRCNQIVKWIDPDDGSLKQWWCVVDYDVSGTGAKLDKDINTANAHFTLIVQGNQDTRKLKVNQRLLFNQNAYKISGYNNMLQNGIVNNTTTLLYIDLYLDTIHPDDDLVNNIADPYDYVYNVTVTPDVDEQVSGFTGQLKAQVTLNNEVVSRTVIWSSNQYGTIDANGNYVLSGEAGNTAIFTCTFGDIVKTINIDIVETPTDKYEIVITPLITEILQGQSVAMTAYLYKNGVQQSDNVSATISGGDSTSCYQFTVSGHTFTLQNKLRSIAPIIITFTSNNITKNISVTLKAMF